MDRTGRAALHRRSAEEIYREGVAMVLEGTNPAVGVLRVREAADRGYLPAMLQLGSWYQDGDAVLPKDGYRAMYWFNKGADKGEPGCKRKIGDIYRHGLLGMKRSEDEAVVWYLRAAEDGDFGAVRSLWELAESGSGAVDRILVAPYLRYAAESGEPSAMVLYGKELVSSGKKKDGYNWLRRAAKSGSVLAKRELGIGYINGDGKISEGVDILTEVASDGDAESQYVLGHYYAAGSRLAQDYQRAFYWYRKAADQEFPEAENAVGDMYRRGLGTDMDLEAAMEYFQRSASHGCAAAMFNIGTMYDTGEGVPTLYRDAAEWYRKAADLGSTPAMIGLGRMYECGHGVRASREEAMRLYIEARERGDPSADAAISRLTSL